MIPTEIKNSLSDEIFKNKISGSLTTVAANFVYVICVELNMLTWLMTNPFVASVLILVIVDPRDPLTYQQEGCCKQFQMW